MGSGIGKYDGNTKPETWLANYLVAVQIGGGNENVTMRNLSLYLEGSARAWLNNLPKSSIYTLQSWKMSSSRTLRVRTNTLEVTKN